MKGSRFGPPPAARSISDLLALEREAFVVTAYIALLGRRPEAEGLSLYLARMRDGMAKDEVILALAESDEGRRTARDLPGLAALLNTTRRRRSRARGVLARIGSALLAPRLHAALRAHDWAIADRLAEQERSVALLVEGIDAQVRGAIDARIERIDAATAELERQAARLARLQGEIEASLRALAGAVGSGADGADQPADVANPDRALDDDAIRRVRARLEAA